MKFRSSAKGMKPLRRGKRKQLRVKQTSVEAETVLRKPTLPQTLRKFTRISTNPDYLVDLGSSSAVPLAKSPQYPGEQNSTF
jgi:hypothetical protein